jgi:hypothetical protein
MERQTIVVGIGWLTGPVSYLDCVFTPLSAEALSPYLSAVLKRRQDWICLK